jgi:hypothetical protein
MGYEKSVTLRTEGGGAMSEFAIRMSGKQVGEEVSPNHAPLKEIKEILDALYALINRTSNTNEPSAVSFHSGSLIVVTRPPQQTLDYLDAVAQQRHLNKDEPYMDFISKLERVSRVSGLDFSFLRDDVQIATITPKEGASLSAREPIWIHTTLTFSGEIMNMGGVNTNVHIRDDQTSETRIVSIDRQTVVQMRLYDRYVFDVDAEQVLWDASKLRNMRYRAHLAIPKAMTIYDLISSESKKWSDIENPEDWVGSIRGRSD